MTYLQKILNEIMAIPSVYGDTTELMNKVLEEFTSLGLSCSKYHNGAVLATLKGKTDNPSITLTAHGDTLGAMVRSLENNGRTGIDPIGGYFLETIHGENGFLKTGGGKVFSGTFIYDEASYHINKEIAQKKWSVKKMFFHIDERIKEMKDYSEHGISIGDIIYFDPRTIWTDKDYIKSRFLDDKAGLAILLSLCRTLVGLENPPAKTIHFLVTPSEEMGLGGRVGIPESTSMLIGIDMGVVGRGQHSNEYAVSICAKDSVTVFDLAIRQHMVNLARKHDIPYTVDVFYHYGSDVYAALAAGIDTRTALIGPGIFNSHGYERTHLKSLLATHDLLKLFVLDPVC